MYSNNRTEDRAYGCFFLFVLLLPLIVTIALIAVIVVGIDLAYENWG